MSTKLKKGCGKNFFVGMSELGVIEFQCGKWKEIKPNHSKMLWCPICADKIIESLEDELMGTNLALKDYKHDLDRLRENLKNRK